MNLFSGLTPQAEDLAYQFPGWPAVIAYGVAYLVVGVVLYVAVRFALVRFIRHQARKQERALALPPGPARDRALANAAKRLGKVQAALLRVTKIAIAAIGVVFLIGDLFPSLDMLSSTLSVLLIGGTALGLAGALQPFIRDVIGGSLIFFEDAYSVGDFVKVAGVEGTVEELHLRRTVIRANDGSVHTVPNGAVGIATNMSRVWSSTTVEIVLAHDVDLERAIAVADATAATLAEDPGWAERIIEPPRVTRVSDVSPDGVTIRLAGRVVSGEAGPVAGELRRRLHHACLQAEIPLARRHDAVVGHLGATGSAATGSAATGSSATGAPGPAAPAPPASVTPDAAAPAADRRGAVSDPRTPDARR